MENKAFEDIPEHVSTRKLISIIYICIYTVHPLCLFVDSPFLNFYQNGHRVKKKAEKRYSGCTVYNLHCIFLICISSNSVLSNAVSDDTNAHKNRQKNDKYREVKTQYLFNRDNQRQSNQSLVTND